MRLKVFQARTLAQAMMQIRGELGPDALLLATRRIAGGVEVTAALEPDMAGDGPAPPRGDALALDYHAVPAALAARLAADGPLEDALVRLLRFEPLALLPARAPVLLAGPPGAGKTLTAARLATRLVLAGRAPLVVTADAQRAGGAEQLAAFTRLLGVRLFVAEGGASLGAALAQREPGRAAIIDLPGSDPRHAQERAELAALAGVAAGELVTVLPAGLDPAEAAELAQGYREAGARRLVVTRLDVARRLGAVVAAAHAGLALSDAGIGPGAADGLVPLTPALLAGRLARIPEGPAIHG